MLAELRNLQKYREKEVGAAAQILALGLSSRKNMCIHPEVAEEGSRESVDAKCRKLTASWVRGCVGGAEGDYVCGYSAGYTKLGFGAHLTW